MTLRRGWALAAAALVLLSACSSSKTEQTSPTPTRSCTPNCSADTIQIRPLIAPVTKRSGACPDKQGATTATVCDATQVYQLGLVIVSGTDVVYAEPEAPTAPQTGWAVRLSLSAKGQADLALYTSLHNLGGGAASAGDPASCTPSGQEPCADYLTFVVAGSVVATQIMIDAITGGSIVVGGAFTEQQARSLAASAAP